MEARLRFTVVTLLPELIEPALGAGVVGRAREAGVIVVGTVNPREFTHDKHRTVDDTPYGGGPGMVMKPEPLLQAIAKATAQSDVVPRRIALTPAGTPLTQARVKALAQEQHLILVCGRYEGMDERVLEEAIDEELSIGDYVLSGGELAALVVIDAVARLVPGVLGDQASADDESHSAGLLEYPQYTRPLSLASAQGEAREVPAILTSGNHAAIAAWRRQQAMTRTARRRGDLWARFAPTKSDRKLLPPALASRTHLALVHFPCVDRTGKVITTSLTNFDIHDLARSALTYGLAGYHLVTPITAHREKAAHVATLWREEAASQPQVRGLADSRAHALKLVRTVDSIETMIAEITADHGGVAPLVVATSAREGAFLGVGRRTPVELVAECAVSPGPVLLLLGTGWGLAESLIPSVSRVLAPISGTSDWNHLSVRSAGAILLDRMFGRAP